ncbi:hypothetical protein N7517_001480 [Penicillium concentricum]|uniref:ADF-H domain-containing protein n=1 Tax=Penicillium concentricum TaxID=293559 RepID=A0A9W9SU42_9EURO|nr:uncharacterized protein N7517_001480 [Penicillium concentricum]KAJ5383569.1 hypothetical protein N7517_001480 [Penicillium concentricum]
MPQYPQGYFIFSAAECISDFNRLRSGPEATRPKFMIYKLSDDNQDIVAEETSTEKDYDTFLLKLWESVDKDGNLAPRYAIYDMEYDLPEGEGKRHWLCSNTTLFVRWGNCHAPLKQNMRYLARMQFRGVDPNVLVVEADSLPDL